MNSHRHIPNSINHEEVEAQASAWLAKQDHAGNWTQEDELALQAWLARRTAHRVAWLRLRQTWVRADQMRRLPREALTDRRGPMAPVSPRRPVRRLGAALACACVLALSGALAWRAGMEGQDEVRFVTAVGARQEVTLEDGSNVLLNTRTHARVVINDRERKFWLDEGEAFFEIKHDPLHPFIVTAGRDRITVLGTKFSVRHEGGRTQVIVAEGRVAVDRADAPIRQGARSSTTLLRNDSAVSEMGKVLVTRGTQQLTEQELSWREGVIEFDNKSLQQVAAEFNRYNRRQLVVKSDAGALLVSGRMEAHNVDGFVRLVHTGFDVVVRAEDDQIYLSMK